MFRPEGLHKVPIPDGIARKFPECCEDMVNRGYGPCITTNHDQEWDMVLEMTYNDGWTVLELDKDEHLTHAYRRPLN